ncbi:angiotensin-converting enzyme-like [Homalodisca vitripennis]|uniref:angiotensin-converting enzyme-like n=1 Tax=Homalodisca vitripennis TaxID=197043 RepID=UPI001EEA1FD3|nr:angiotensin-converting enzyme-like [Homalodisca vitripennis]
MEWLVLAALLSLTYANYTEEEGATFMVLVSNRSQHLQSILVHKLWDYDTSLTDEAAQELSTAQENYTKYQEDIYPEVVKYPWRTFKDPLLRRQFKFLSQPDEAALTTEKRTRLANVIAEMVDIYSSMKIKEYQSSNSTPTLNIDDISNKLANSDNPCEMAYYWDGWHTSVGKAVKDRFQEYVELENEAAVLNNYTDNAAKWIAKYETDDFENVIAKLMKKIRPLFKQLHAYVRRKLWLYYGKDSTIIDLKGPIPASLLGNLWGLDGINVYTKSVPYPNKTSLDISDQLVAQNYTGLKMAKTAEQFYVSINMSAMTEKFWKYSIFERPATGNIDCSPSGYRFFDGEDYRIRICTSPTMDFLGRVHHEMAHIENYMAWKDLPWLFQDASNPGFDEVLGDMVYLFVVNPTHLKRLGLLDSSFEFDDEQEINALYQQALATVFFLPYAYSLELWRWKVFQGKIKPDHYNCPYWEIRLKEQGVAPPVDRDDSDFDPGAKYHVNADLPSGQWGPSNAAALVSMYNGFQTYRLKEQGVAPPVDRDDSDFDPGAKYHVNADLPNGQWAPSNAAALVSMHNGFQTYRLKEQGVAPPVDRDDTDFDPGAKYHVNTDLPNGQWGPSNAAALVSMYNGFQTYRLKEQGVAPPCRSR